MSAVEHKSGKSICKALMKNVFSLLLLFNLPGCAWSGGDNFEKNELNRVSQLQVTTKEDLKRVTWVVDNLSEDEQSYIVTWLDGTGNKTEVWSTETIVELKVPPCHCLLKTTVTVSPINKDNVTTGVNETMSFICQDIVSITSLEAEEEMIHVFWLVRCPSGSITGFNVMWHREPNGYEMVCQFSGSASNTSSKDGCHGRQQQLQKCSSYEVSIYPRSNTFENIFLSAERASQTWTKECDKNVSRETQSITTGGDTEITSLSQTIRSTYSINEVTSTAGPSVSLTRTSSTVDLNPESYQLRWKTIVILAVTIMCCTLVVLALVAIAVSRKRRMKMNTEIQVSTVTPNLEPLPSVPESDNGRASLTESLVGHAYCYPNITPNVRREIRGEVIELRDYPVQTTGQRREAAVEIFNSYSDSRLKSKKDKVAAAISLLARVQDEDDYNTVRSHLFREPQEEKLEEAIRLLNEFVSAGGGSSELTEMQSRQSVAESLGGHSYCYPQLSKEVIDRVISDAKKRKKPRPK